MKIHRILTVLFILAAISATTLAPQSALAIRGKDRLLVGEYGKQLRELEAELNKQQQVLQQKGNDETTTVNALKTATQVVDKFANLYPKVEADYEAAISWYASKGWSYKKGKQFMLNARKRARATRKRFTTSVKKLENVLKIADDALKGLKDLKAKDDLNKAANEYLEKMNRLSMQQ